MTVMNGEVGCGSEARNSIASSYSRGIQTLRRKGGFMEASMGVSLNNDNCCSLNGDGFPPLFIHSLSLT